MKYILFVLFGIASLDLFIYATSNDISTFYIILLRTPYMIWITIISYKLYLK